MSCQRQENINDMIVELRQDIIFRSQVDVVSDDQKHKDKVEKYEKRIKSLELQLKI